MTFLKCVPHFEEVWRKLASSERSKRYADNSAALSASLYIIHATTIHCIIISDLVSGTTNPADVRSLTLKPLK